MSLSSLLSSSSLFLSNSKLRFRFILGSYFDKCADLDPDCRRYEMQGLCSDNPTLALKRFNCKKTCQLCSRYVYDTFNFHLPRGSLSLQKGKKWVKVSGPYAVCRSAWHYCFAVIVPVINIEFTGLGIATLTMHHGTVLEHGHFICGLFVCVC